MTDKTRKRRKAFAASHNVSCRTAANMLAVERDARRDHQTSRRVEVNQEHGMSSTSTIIDHMPQRIARPKRYDPTKITVYPDNSTLCAAFKAHRNLPDAPEYSAYLPLRDWFERVAHEANLCLSTTHIVELFRWDDTATADEMVRWYDRLPIVWAKSMHKDVEEFETERWTRIAAGVEVDPNAKPFATSLLTAFRSMNLDAAAALLAEREPSLAMLRAMRGSAVWHQRYEAYNADYIEMLMAVLRNHQHFTALGWTDERKRQETGVNVRRTLWDRAAEIDRRLTVRGDAVYAQKPYVAREIPGRLLELYEREPRTMPMFRVIQRFNEGANAHVERGQVVNGEPSNSLRKTFQSSFADWMHLVGAAYCDVFTCDRTVSGWLGDVRETLGLRPQLAVRGYPGGPQAFVRDLMATWP